MSESKTSSAKSFLGIEKSTAHVIFAMVIPAIIELALSSLFGMVDYIMASQYSTDALNAIGLYASPSSVFTAAFSAINVGTTTLVAWNIGAGKSKEAGRIMRVSMMLNLALGIVITVITTFFAPDLIAFISSGKYGSVTDKGSVASDAVDVFRLCTSTLAFQAMSMSITSSLRGAGENRIPLFYSFSANLLNVFGNYIFIYGVKALSIPEMGAQGAALSTALCKLFAFIIAIVYLAKSRNSKLSFRNTKEAVKEKCGHIARFIGLFTDKYVMKILRIGIPAAGENITLQLGIMLFTKIVASTGQDSYAAHQIANNISSFFTSVCSAFAVASNALMGQCLGAGDKKNAKHYVSSVCTISVASSAVLGIIMFFFAGNVAHIYTDEAVIRATASNLIRIFAFTLVALSFQSSVSGALRGAGDTKFPFYIAIFCVLILRVSLAAIVVYVFDFGITAVWCVTLFDQLLRGVIMYVRYKSERWNGKVKVGEKAEL